MAISVEDVESTAVSKLAYDEDRRELYFRYSGGGRYPYFRVPLKEFLALRSAGSVGAYVNQVIKRKYRFAEGAPI